MSYKSYELLDKPASWRTRRAVSDNITSYPGKDPKKLSSQNPVANASEYPSVIDTPTFTSRWTISWRVPTLTASLYVLGVHAIPNIIWRLES